MKKWILVILIIALTTLTSAQLSISPNPINIDVKVGEQKTFQLTMNNSFNFAIMDFEFTNLTGFTFPNVTLDPHTSGTIDFTVNRQNSISASIPSKVGFKYLVELPQEIETHYINITEMGYSPNFLAIKQGDTVVWRNIDDITHTVTSGIFDYNIGVNQSASHLFNEVREVNYQDLIVFYGGTIDVLNKTAQSKAHNPNYDIIWTVNVNSISDPTQLQVTIDDNDYTVEATGVKEGSIKIENIGNKTAERIELTSSSDWLKFDENNFDLATGDKNFVTFKIQPRIYSSNETNMTYHFDVTVKASNSDPYITPISVYVPYSDVMEDLDTAEGFLTWFWGVYCVDHPEIFLCNTSATTGGGEGGVEYRDVEIPMNVSAVDFYNLIRRIQRMEDSNQRTDNELKLLADKWGLTMPQLMNLMNQSVALQVENEDKEKESSISRWIFGICVLISISIFLIVRAVSKYNYKKNLAGEYHFKR
ncbi:MAG: hypothetical protein KKF56_05010 [Nanoarchaeota archaeon]|nr:hypothetical protein [Nanoarchaeota archaeon]